MEETKPVKTGAGESLSAEQVTSVSGGDATATASVSTSNVGISTTTSAPDVGTALISIYEGFVDVTSHVIERVVNAAK